MLQLQLYVHFPFCKQKCRYCDFCSSKESTETVAAYISALQKEIAARGAECAGMRVSTVYLGGGTPSILPPRTMSETLNALRSAFDIAPDAEITAEANPGTLTEAWLNAVRAGGVNRLSLGVQAAQDDLLSTIGRIHTFAQAQEAFTLARQCGFDNLSADVMFGLPGQTREQYRETLARVLALEPCHLSAYSLILEPGTPLCESVESGALSLPDEDAAADMYEQGIKFLEARGYKQYEISNFAKSGFMCRHNIGYWTGEYYLGLGIAAHSMLPANAGEKAKGAVYIRRANAPDLLAYIGAGKHGELPPCASMPISAREAMFETMMLGLRMNAGVSETDFYRRHGRNLKEVYGSALDTLIEDGLARFLPEGRFALTPRGLEMQNDALLRLMEE